MELDLPIQFEIGSFVVLTLILVLDLLIIFKRPHVPSMTESSLWVFFYVCLALIFAGLMYYFAGAEAATQFVGGWLTEYSLSIDNLFVFTLIMSQFGVQKRYQQEVLMIGIVLALIFRGVFILLGAQLIQNFNWIFYIFGAFLIYTAYKQVFQEESEEGENNEPSLVRYLRRRMSISPYYDGMKLRSTYEGKRVWTPMVIVLISLGFTDLLFALDSIPAIFGITQSPFIVFTANVFALMGLRQLYFLLGGLLDRLKFLHYGIAFILAFIGVKLVFHAMHANSLSFLNGGEPIHWVPNITTEMSLAVIVLSMLVSTVASLFSGNKIKQSKH